MYHSEFHLEKIEDLPDEAYWHAVERLENQRMQRVKAAKTFQETLTELRKQYLDEFHSIIGEEYLPRYLRLHNRRIREMGSLTKRIPKTREGLQQLEKKRVRNIKETAKLVKRAGVDVDRIRLLQKEFKEKKATALHARLGSVQAGPSPRPQELRSDEWVSLRPYIWNNSDCDRDSTKGPESYSYQIDCDVSTGRMKHESNIRIKDAGDNEEAYVISLTEIGTVAWVRQDCNAVRVIAVFDNIASSAEGSGSDECGFSSYLVDNGISAVVRVGRFYPEGDSQEKRAWVEDEDGNRGTFLSTPREDPADGFIHAWDFDFWEPGEAVFTPVLTFPGPYERGTWLSVWVGLNAWNVVLANDYAINDFLRYELKLNAILVNFQ